MCWLDHKVVASTVPAPEKLVLKFIFVNSRGKTERYANIQPGRPPSARPYYEKHRHQAVLPCGFEAIQGGESMCGRIQIFLSAYVDDFKVVH